MKDVPNLFAHSPICITRIKQRIQIKEDGFRKADMKKGKKLFYSIL